jgi:hypothetical protein
MTEGKLGLRENTFRHTNGSMQGYSADRGYAINRWWPTHHE